MTFSSLYAGTMMLVEGANGSVARRAPSRCTVASARIHTRRPMPSTTATRNTQ